jgi:hyaluronoglucosaminidase
MPQFKFRGVVEGFYGQPWTHQNRLEAIYYFKQFNFNTYVIAPKNDRNQRLNWRELLNGKKLEELSELISAGERNNVAVSESVSPGHSVVYSSQIDRDFIVARFQQQLNLGAKHLFLLWDDIDWELTNQNDIDLYKDIAIAQADFSNYVFSRLSPVEFTICPMVYWGRGSSNYLSSLGDYLDKDINLMWTGRQIRSEYIDYIDAVEFQKQAKRKPFYWDNYPVNNLNLRHELHMGPLVGRDKNLSEAAVGLLANPMLQFNASLPSLFTIGKYLETPHNYEPNLAWNEALEFLYKNEDERNALRVFIDANTKSQLGGDVSPLFRSSLQKIENERKNANYSEAAEICMELSIRIQNSYNLIINDGFSKRDLYIEILPWLENFRIHGINLGNLAKFFESKCTNIMAITEMMQQIDHNRHQVFGDILWEYLQELFFEYMTT